MINHLLKSLIAPFKTIAIFCLWFLLTTLITISLSKLEKEYYTPTDTPNERFMVGGQRWQDFKTNSKPIITKPYGDCTNRYLGGKVNSYKISNLIDENFYKKLFNKNLTYYYN